MNDSPKAAVDNKKVDVSNNELSADVKPAVHEVVIPIKEKKEEPETPSVMDFTSARDDHLKALKRNRQFFESDTEVRYSTGIGSLSPLSVSGKRSLSSVVMKNK